MITFSSLAPGVSFRIPSPVSSSLQHWLHQLLLRATSRSQQHALCRRPPGENEQLWAVLSYDTGRLAPKPTDGRARDEDHLANNGGCEERSSFRGGRAVAEG